jgi:Flp pilus assembly protein TadG
MRTAERFRRKSARGAAAVEFAIVLPILFLLVFGVMEWGYYFFIETTVLNAAREGARAGSVASIDIAENRARAAVQTALTGGSLDATKAESILVTVTADSIVVSVAYPTGALTGVEFIPLPARAFGRAEMRRY